MIYYFQREDGAIKIGTSRQPAKRLLTLRREFGPLDVLAVEPGDRQRERELHERFAKSRLTGEWFRPSGRLKKHIAMRARTHGTERWMVILQLQRSYAISAAIRAAGR